MPSPRTIRKPTRWTPEEWRHIEEAAHARGVPPLRYVREAALAGKLPPRAAGRVRARHGAHELVRQLKRLLNDLHQLARVADKEQDDGAAEALRITIDVTESAVKAASARHGGADALAAITAEVVESGRHLNEVTHGAHIIEALPGSAELSGARRMAAVMEICRETRRRRNSVRQLAMDDIDLSSGTVRWQGEFDKVGKTRVNPLTRNAVKAILRALEHRRAEGMEHSPWLIPAEANAAQPVPRSRLDNWMRATKKATGLNIPRLGYHGEKRAGIRDPKFRRLDPAVQEELAGTTWETMRRVYDYVDMPTLQNAVALLETDTDEPTSTVPQIGTRCGLKRAAWEPAPANRHRTQAQTLNSCKQTTCATVA